MIVMKTPEKVKAEKISHLEDCMEKLLRKDDGSNEFEIVRIYRLIYRVACEMKKLDESNALKYFNNNVDNEVRDTLKRLNIELMV